MKQTESNKKHGRITDGIGYDSNNKNTWGYYPEDLSTHEGRKQMILNGLDKHPSMRFDPFYNDIPEGYFEKDHFDGNDLEQACISLASEGLLKSSSGLSYKLAVKKVRVKDGN